MAEDYELLGDDYDEEGLQGTDIELLGDAEIASRVRRSIRERGFTRDRGLLLGFGTQTGVASGVTVDFSANTQVPFRCKRPIIESTVGVGPISLEDIKVGKNSQLASAASFPAGAFAANAFDIGVKFDTATPGIDIVITLTNNDAMMATNLSVGMFGYAAER